MRQNKIKDCAAMGDNLIGQKLDLAYSDPERGRGASQEPRGRQGKMTSPLEREIGGTEGMGALTPKLAILSFRRSANSS